MQLVLGASKARSGEVEVLVLESSSAIRSRLGRTFQALGGVSLLGGAESVEEAMELAQGATPDLVVMDIGAANGGVIDLIRAFKQRDPEPVVVVLTSTSEFPYPEHCRAAGADHCLDKGREMGRLEAIVAELVEARSRPSPDAPGR